MGLRTPHGKATFSQTCRRGQETSTEALLAAVGDTGIKEALLQGKKTGDRTFKVHVDGYNLLPALKGEAEWQQNFCIGPTTAAGGAAASGR